MAETEAHLAHPENKGINPAVAVAGAILVAGALVFASYIVFNRSKAATAAREISKQHQEIRKEETKNSASQTQSDTGSSPVTVDSIDKQTQQIDNTLRSNDLGSDQVQADDLSDKGLGLQ